MKNFLVNFSRKLPAKNEQNPAIRNENNIDGPAYFETTLP